MIERHLQHLRDRKLHLQCPCHEMTDMLGVGADHLGAEKSSRAFFRIDMKQAAILENNAAAALILERRLANDERAGLEVREACARDGELRIAKYDRERRAPQP